MEPLQLGIIGALVPDDIDVSLQDDRCETIDFNQSADLVFITVETFTARRAYEISREFRRRRIPVVLGGIHPTLMPVEAGEHADSIFTGDSETLIPELISDFRKNRLKKQYHGKTLIPQRGILPRRELYRGKGYLPISLLQFGRGCRFSCSYCAVSSYFHRNHYCRPVKEVIDEIENQERKYLFFVDDNIIADHEAAKELFRALIPLKIRWVSQASLDLTSDSELMELMMKSGCMGNVIGFESLNPENLSGSRKRTNIRGAESRYSEEIKVLRDYGHQTWAAFTLGYDGDTDDSIRQTLDFALENKFTFAAFNILMPYPGTDFYSRMEKEGRLLYDGKWWLHPEYRFNHAAFIPSKLTPDQLSRVCFSNRKTFNSLHSILLRAFDLKTNMRNPVKLGTYLAYNPLFRRETFKKQGMRLGLEK